MKTSHLPNSPRDVLSLSPPLRLFLKSVLLSADVFGFWNAPKADAEADFEDMKLVDKMYWAYKAGKPVLKPEPGLDPDSFAKSDLSGLPDGFQKETTTTMSAVGDLIKVTGLKNSQDVLYASVADLIFGQDISCGNLESPITRQALEKVTFQKNETPPICCTPEDYHAIKGHGKSRYTILNTACNHTFDTGLEGISATTDQLRKDGITQVGINNRDGEQLKGVILEKNGINVGFVSATFGLNGKTLPDGKEYLVNVVKFHQKGIEENLSPLKEQIEHCQKTGCDLIVAQLHWGYEYEFYPRKEQINLAHRIVELGVDVILSHHAHVIQPIEHYRCRRDPDRVALIAYSLGNLTSEYSAPNTVLSAILNLSLTKGTHKGTTKTYLETAEVIPVVQMDSNKEGQPKIRLETLDKLCREDREKESPRLKTMIDYAERIFGYQAPLSSPSNQTNHD